MFIINTFSGRYYEKLIGVRALFFYYALTQTLLIKKRRVGESGVLNGTAMLAQTFI